MQSSEQNQNVTTSRRGFVKASAAAAVSRASGAAARETRSPPQTLRLASTTAWSSLAWPCLIQAARRLRECSGNIRARAW